MYRLKWFEMHTARERAKALAEASRVVQTTGITRADVTLESGAEIRAQSLLAKARGGPAPLPELDAALLSAAAAMEHISPDILDAFPDPVQGHAEESATSHQTGCDGPRDRELRSASADPGFPAFTGAFFACAELKERKARESLARTLAGDVPQTPGEEEVAASLDALTSLFGAPSAEEAQRLPVGAEAEESMGNEAHKDGLRSDGPSGGATAEAEARAMGDHVVATSAAAEWEVDSELEGHPQSAAPPIPAAPHEAGQGADLALLAQLGCASSAQVVRAPL